MTPPQALFHALLRPSILQILRAAGYHGAKSSVIDLITDLAVRYLSELCRMTALYAAHNGSNRTEPTIVDVRMALQHVGALLPEKF
jgi:transcription initiation factor TFIID subunit 3